ncbi:hypothetical protein [Streptomyces sp. CB00455]|uniref:hypothetical protein n=1 Tax=Streptomyces sp. CB00455 TaxID=1703927 RepID=UPI000AD965AF|nr:hypothetical protein [Streptomyces sp. CB00455]
MPRKRPGALRAERGTHEGRRPPAWARELPPVDRLSAVAGAGVHWTSPQHAEMVPYLLGMYRTFLRTPGDRLRPVPSQCPACPGCARDDVAVVRDELVELHQSLAPVARLALGRVLRALDEEFRRRTLPAPVPPHSVDRQGRPRAWWHHRLYEGD